MPKVEAWCLLDGCDCNCNKKIPGIWLVSTLFIFNYRPCLRIPIFGHHHHHQDLRWQINWCISIANICQQSQWEKFRENCQASLSVCVCVCVAMLLLLVMMMMLYIFNFVILFLISFVSFFLMSFLLSFFLSFLYNLFFYIAHFLDINKVDPCVPPPRVFNNINCEDIKTQSRESRQM